MTLSITTPVNFSTFRADTVAALLAVLNAYKAANPTKLKHLYTARPGSFPELPCAYIGNRNESITHDSGTRTRSLGPTVVLVDAFTDYAEQTDRMDVLVDGLVEWFTANPRIIGTGAGTVLQMDGATDTEIELAGATGPVFYRACVLTFGQTEAQEGRN